MAGDGRPDKTPARSRQEQAVQLQSSAVVSGALSVFLVASLVVVHPLLGMLIAPFGTVPLLRVIAAGQRSILAWSWAAAVLVALIILLPDGIGNMAASLLPTYLVVAVLPVLTVEWWLRFGWSEGRWAAIAILSEIIACLVITAALAEPVSPVEGMTRHFHFMQGALSEGYQAAGMSSNQIHILLGFLGRATIWFSPALLMLYPLAVLFWIRPRLQLLGLPIQTNSFEEYRSEEWLPAAFAITGISVLLLSGTARWVAGNLLAAVLALYFIHGLAIIRAHLARWIGRGWFVRWGIVLLCLPLPLPFLVSTLGLADSFYQLRPQVSETGGNHEGHS